MFLYLYILYENISLFFRKRRSEKESKDAPVNLDNIGSGPMDSTTTTENLVYSNAAELNTSPKKDKIYQNVETVAT